ncbi:MAG: alpha/beta fold hydrolase [Chloroflexi bacterium CFX4]|nr:alpha/beta fold hydrolase [Chloroflexi bacterium CFX4]MDL1924433.1 alpha/beta fold hydrolase [Chloroflexi bacterium CFX3]
MRLLIFCLALLSLLSLPWSAAAQADQLPYAAKGQYAVGVARLREASNTNRVLEGFIWYPAQPNTGQGVMQYGLGKRSQSAVESATPERSGAPYPLIIFSHGYGSIAAQSTFLIEHLAAHGFAVISINHPGSTFGDTDSATGLTLGWYARPRDVMQMIAWAERQNADPQSILYGMLALDQIGVSGHSYGGYTALAAGGAQLDFRALEAYCAAEDIGFDFACLAQRAEPILAPILSTDAATQTLVLPHDPRVAAVLAMAPFNAPIMGEKGLAAVRAPTFVMVGTADSVTPPERDAYRIYEQVGSTQKGLLSFEGAEHTLFADCLPILAERNARCNDEVWEADLAHAIVQHFATAFFLATLKGDSAAQQALINAPTLEAVRYTATFR